MSKSEPSDSELEEQLQQARVQFEENWVEVHVLTDALRVPSRGEIESWRALHAQGLRGAGIQIVIIDHFAGNDSHGAAIEALIRAIAPDAVLRRIPLPEEDDGTSTIVHVARALEQAGEMTPDVVNVSFAHPVEWSKMYGHRDSCEAARSATACTQEDPLRMVVASTGNAGLGVLGCPSLARQVRRVGSVTDASVAEDSIPALLEKGAIGTSFSAARMSGFTAVLASMYPGLCGRMLFDAIGVVAGFTHWPTLGMAVELAPVVRFFRGWISEDALTGDDWRSLAAQGISNRHALSAGGQARDLAARLAAHRARAWSLVGGVEARRNGQSDISEGRLESAISWLTQSIRLLERSGQKIEAAKSRVSLAGTMMDIPRQWTVVGAGEAARYVDPTFTEIDRLLQSALKEARSSSEPDRPLEAVALNSLCALYQQHDNESELRRAEEFGRQALDLLGQNRRNEESVRAMLNLANALYRLALHTRSQRTAAWSEQLKRAEQLALQCVSDKYEDTLKFALKARDLVAKIHELMS